MTPSSTLATERMGTPSTSSAKVDPIHFVTPPLYVSLYVDNKHKVERVQFRSLENLRRDTSTNWETAHMLDEELHLANAKEPLSFAMLNQISNGINP